MMTRYHRPGVGGQPPAYLERCPAHYREDSEAGKPPRRGLAGNDWSRADHVTSILTFHCSPGQWRRIQHQPRFRVRSDGRRGDGEDSQGLGDSTRADAMRAGQSLAEIDHVT